MDVILSLYVPGMFRDVWKKKCPHFECVIHRFVLALNAGTDTLYTRVYSVSSLWMPLNVQNLKIKTNKKRNKRKQNKTDPGDKTTSNWVKRTSSTLVLKIPSAGESTTCRGSTLQRRIVSGKSVSFINVVRLVGTFWLLPRVVLLASMSWPSGMLII